MSGRIAFSVSAVSIRLSPLRTLEAAGWKLETCAPSRLPAISNEKSVRVRVLEEGVDLGEAGEPVVGLARAAVERDPRLGLVEDGEDVGGGKPLDPEQMAVGEGRRASKPRSSFPHRQAQAAARPYCATRLTVPTWQRLTLRMSVVSPSS